MNISELLSKLEISEKTTKEAMSNYQALVDAAPDALIAVDEVGRILMWNRAAEEIFGYTENEVIEKDLSTLIFPDNKANVLQLESIYKLMDLSSDIRNMIPSIIQSEALTREGQLFPIEISVTRRRRITGSINTIIIRDITELKKTQAEMARLDRLNLVGQIAAGIGHEIRNPMTTVRGYLQLLGEKPAYAEQKPTFDLMISELDRANFIITEFLSLAKTSKSELQIQNLNNVLKGMYPLIEAEAYTQNKQIQFIPGQIPNLLLNEKEIIQLVFNICRNGFEAIEDRGCVTIQTYTEDNNVVLTVEDDGCGIPKEYLQKIGTPFFTTKGNGTGLGLSICYKIAHKHNAIIDIHSSPTGTTFILRFAIPNDNGLLNIE